MDSGYSFRLSIQAVNSSYALHWGYLIRLSIPAMHSSYSFKLPVQAIHSGYLSRPSIQAIYSGYTFRLKIQAMHSSYSFRLCIQALHSGCASEAKHFLTRWWKRCQTMRLDALIIFPIEWRHNIWFSRDPRIDPWATFSNLFTFRNSFKFSSFFGIAQKSQKVEKKGPKVGRKLILGQIFMDLGSHSGIDFSIFSENGKSVK